MFKFHTLSYYCKGQCVAKPNQSTNWPQQPKGDNHMSTNNACSQSAQTDGAWLFQVILVTYTRVWKDKGCPNHKGTVQNTPEYGNGVCVCGVHKCIHLFFHSAVFVCMHGISHHFMLPNFSHSLFQVARFVNSSTNNVTTDWSERWHETYTCFNFSSASLKKCFKTCQAVVKLHKDDCQKSGLSQPSNANQPLQSTILNFWAP